MMISPEDYHEMHLKGKDCRQLLTVIRGLKKRIGHLKNTMEYPDYGTRYSMRPGEDTQLRFARLCLERARAAYEEAGGQYVLSQAERKTQNFDENIPFVERVTFCIGGFFGGYETRVFIFEDEHVNMSAEHSLCLKPSNFHIEPDWPMTKCEFLDGLKKLHLGEWRSVYNLRRFGMVACDGTQWRLTVQYSNGRKPFEVHGDNAYPYNFAQLKELLGFNWEMSDDEEY